MATKYRKKPVVIEAIQLEYSVKSRDEIAKWCNGIVDDHHSGITIPTLEGDMYAQVGDYIIKGVAGEFYPCKPEIFKATYESSIFGEKSIGEKMFDVLRDPAFLMSIVKPPELEFCFTKNDDEKSISLAVCSKDKSKEIQSIDKITIYINGEDEYEIRLRCIDFIAKKIFIRGCFSLCSGDNVFNN